MKHFEFLVPLLLLAFSCSLDVNSDVKTGTTTNKLEFDSLLAEETGADQYGMRQYIIAYLKSGPNRNQDSTQVASIQRAHLDNMAKMADAGKLVLAGPFLDDQNVKGIYIFAVESIGEAEELTNSDPAIQAGRLIMELHPWYGSAALMKVNELHAKLSKESI